MNRFVHGNTQLVEDVIECLCKKPVFKALETLTNSFNSLESRVELNSANLQLLTELHAVQFMSMGNVALS